MKQLLLLTALLFTLTNNYAQSSNAEAKAAYLLAEDAFAASDWKGTLSYLEECKKLIGTPNSKILYLQILTELELAKTDTAYNTAALKTIAAFEKAPDVKDFNEDKALEVMKSKIRLNRIQDQAAKEKLAREEHSKWLKTLGGVVVAEKDGHGFVMANADIGKMNQEDAKKACEDLVVNGYDDWRLPTMEEFYQIVTISSQLVSAKPLPAEFVSLKGMYWTTTFYSEKKIKKQAYAVRPVRTF